MHESVNSLESKLKEILLEAFKVKLQNWFIVYYTLKILSIAENTSTPMFNVICVFIILMNMKFGVDGYSVLI